MHGTRAIYPLARFPTQRPTAMDVATSTPDPTRRAYINVGSHGTRTDGQPGLYTLFPSDSPASPPPSSSTLAPVEQRSADPLPSFSQMLRRYEEREQLFKKQLIEDEAKARIVVPDEDDGNHPLLADQMTNETTTKALELTGDNIIYKVDQQVLETAETLIYMKRKWLSSRRLAHRLQPHYRLHHQQQSTGNYLPQPPPPQHQPQTAHLSSYQSHATHYQQQQQQYRYQMPPPPPPPAHRQQHYQQHYNQQQQQQERRSVIQYQTKKPSPQYHHPTQTQQYQQLMQSHQYQPYWTTVKYQQQQQQQALPPPPPPPQPKQQPEVGWCNGCAYYNMQAWVQGASEAAARR